MWGAPGRRHASPQHSGAETSAACPCGGSAEPILYGQIRDSVEIPIVRNQSESDGNRVRCDEQVGCAHWPPFPLDPRADSSIHCVGRALEREHGENAEHRLQLRRETPSTSLGRSEAEFRRDDDARRDFRLANGLDPLGNCALRVPDEIRNDVGVEKVRHSEINRFRWAVRRRLQVLLDWLQRRQ